AADFENDAIYAELTWFLEPREVLVVEAAEPHPWTWQGVAERFEDPAPSEDIELHRTEGGGWRLRVPAWIQAILVTLLAGGGVLGGRKVLRRRRNGTQPQP
ncbi:MAG: hypothetical protein ACE5G2_13480, partial [Candidatus Krumholzibacteriia bacterium]